MATAHLLLAQAREWIVQPAIPCRTRLARQLEPDARFRNEYIMRTAAYLLLVAALPPSVSMAGWIDKAKEKLPDTEFRKSDGSFGAWLMLVADDRKLYTDWAKPGASVNVNEVDTVRVNEPVSAFVVFSGCQPDLIGNCSVKMRYRVLSPNGTVHTETPSMEVWLHRSAPPARTWELGVDYLKMAIEPHEQLGNYQIQVQVRDENSGRVLSLQKSFRAASTAET